jgi:hypothetical protein
MGDTTRIVPQSSVIFQTHTVDIKEYLEVVHVSSYAEDIATYMWRE